MTPPAILELLIGDITRLDVDGIVNAANASLLGGGGVDGAIHRAGGPAILDACQEIRRTRYPDGLPTGEAVLTTGGALPARFVIHTVGPIYHSDPDPAQRLADCYRNCLIRAQEAGLTSLAFPAISTGVYGYPKAEAAHIAITTLRAHLAAHPGTLRRIALTAFNQEDGEILRQELNKY